MLTEIALLDRAWLPLAIAYGLVRRELIAAVPLGILGEKANLIRTGDDTGAAADALILIYEHQVVFFPFVAGTRRTDGNTRGLRTVVTTNRQEHLPSSGIGSLFFFQDPHPKNPGRGAVLGLASQSATLTPDATPQINGHAPTGPTAIA